MALFLPYSFPKAPVGLQTHHIPPPTPPAPPSQPQLASPSIQGHNAEKLS